MTNQEISIELQTRLTYICKAIAHEPESLLIDIKEVHGKYLFYLKPSPIDVGVFIGKKGIMVESLRVITRSIGAQLNVALEFHLLEN
jgi:predicted RNA-binding protein YlqC (UPF0109 family)